MQHADHRSASGPGSADDRHGTGRSPGGGQDSCDRSSATLWAQVAEPRTTNHEPRTTNHELRPESRIDDVVEDRSERVRDPETHEVTIVGGELPLLNEDLLGRGFSARQVQLIACPRDLAEDVERKSLEQPD